MSGGPSVTRLEQAASAARSAEARGDDDAAGEAWRRYRLIRDAARDPDELLREGIALSVQALALAQRPRGLSKLEAAHGKLPDSRSGEA